MVCWARSGTSSSATVNPMIKQRPNIKEEKSSEEVAFSALRVERQVEFIVACTERALYLATRRVHIDEDMTAGVVAAKAYLAGSIDRKTLVSISLRLWQTCQQKKLLNNKILENAVLVSYWLTYYIDLYVTADNKNSIATLKTISYNYIPAYTMKIAKDLATSGLLHIQNDTELNERRWQIEYARYLRQKDLGTVSALDHLS